MSRARAADAFVVWVLCVLLAGVFLLTGIAKLLGTETIGLQASAMRGFPFGLRVIVGLVEIAGAIGLLIPRSSTFAALGLAFMMVPAALTQYASKEPGLFVPIICLMLLLWVASRRSSTAIYTTYHSFADHPHPLLRDGVIAGLIGAACVAIWFFVIDMASGRPFFTPITLGRGLTSVLGAVPDDESAVVHVLVYSVFHFAAFMIVGLLAALIVFLAKSEPSILLGFVVLFAAIELGFYGLVGLLSETSRLGNFAWYQVMLGNLIAAAAMGYYFWRTHKELAEQFRHSMDWDAALVIPDHPQAAKAPDKTPGAPGSPGTPGTPGSSERNRPAGTGR